MSFVIHMNQCWSIGRKKKSQNKGENISSQQLTKYGNVLGVVALPNIANQHYTFLVINTTQHLLIKSAFLVINTTPLWLINTAQHLLIKSAFLIPNTTQHLLTKSAFLIPNTTQLWLINFGNQHCTTFANKVRIFDTKHYTTLANQLWQSTLHNIC